MGFFSKYIAPRITITTSPDYFNFIKDGYSLKLKTDVYIKDLKVVSISEKPNTLDSEAQLISLFNSDQPLEIKHRESALILFIQYGIVTCLSNTRKLPINPIIKPRITFPELDKLDNILHGYQRLLLYEVTRPFASEIVIVNDDKETSN